MATGPKVLLAHAYYLVHDAKQWRKMKPYPPLATLLAAAVLRSRGFEVLFFDAMLARGEPEFGRALEASGARIVGILEDNFNFLTKMCTTRSREAALAMTAAARARGCRVAVNGPDATDHAGEYLAAGADAVIVGDPELGMAELAALWSADPEASLGGVAGLLLHGGIGLDRRVAVRRTPTRPLLDDLDALPFPAWDLVDVEAYREAWTKAHGRLSWNVVTTRGCPFRCNWCAKPVWGNRYAQRSPGNVADEVSLLAGTVRPEHVWFADDIFGLTPRWIESFAEALAARGVRIPFTMQSRVDLMTPSAAAALAHAGAEEVWMGVESGSQKVLDAMDKGTRVEQARQATRLLRAHGIRPAWFLQLGYPGEAWEDILATRRLVREERPSDVGVSVSYPLPGTAFYERVRGEMGPQRNWRTSDDLAVMFHGTYEQSFYRHVRDLLHAEVESFRRPFAQRGASFDDRWNALEALEAGFRATLDVSDSDPTPIGLAPV
ncbi:MAG TPA: radical SAM protein [Thermoanaerobaculia bacterium]|nr:radical SAM protein [Thermoanaerobaculia bacterium]